MSLLQCLHVKGPGKGCTDALVCNDTLLGKILFIRSPMWKVKNKQDKQVSIQPCEMSPPVWFMNKVVFAFWCNRQNEIINGLLYFVSTGTSRTLPAPLKDICCQLKFGNPGGLFSASRRAQKLFLLGLTSHTLCTPISFFFSVIHPGA